MFVFHIIIKVILEFFLNQIGYDLNMNEEVKVVGRSKGIFTFDLDYVKGCKHIFKKCFLFADFLHEFITSSEFTPVYF